MNNVNNQLPHKRTTQARISPPTMARVPQPQKKRVLVVDTPLARVMQAYLKTPEAPKPLTHKAKRQARKLFHKGPQVPRGMKLRYSMFLKTDTNPVIPDMIKLQWESLDRASQEKYHKNYSNLTSSEKSKLHEAINTSKEKPAGVK